MKFKILTMCIVGIMLSGCVDGDKARTTLYNNGYTDIRITGYRMFACSNDDYYSTGFRAKSPNGTYVNGTVCSGFMKGSTIRFD